jgi:ABC-type antimicrobial peptide transport system permease subunit
VKLYVVGVVKDVYNRGLWRELQPMMIRFVLPEHYRQLSVNTNVENVAEVNEFMRTKWGEVFPNRLYNGFMMGLDLNEAVKVSEHIVYMFLFVGGVALLLSATGLYSLVSLNIIRRMKEIGVRKVLGASVSNISRIINTEFVIVIGIASVAGCGLSYWMLNMLMGSIWRYYQPLSAMSLVMSTLVLFLISFVAIGYRVFSAANMNPVNTLKVE